MAVVKVKDLQDSLQGTLHYTDEIEMLLFRANSENLNPNYESDEDLLVDIRIAADQAIRRLHILKSKLGVSQ